MIVEKCGVSGVRRWTLSALAVPSHTLRQGIDYQHS